MLYGTASRAVNHRPIINNYDSNLRIYVKGAGSYLYSLFDLLPLLENVIEVLV